MNACYLCRRAKETFNHILLECPIVHNLLTMAHGLFEVNWAMVVCYVKG